MKVYGDLMEHGEVVPHPTVTEEGDELARRFIHSGVSARGLGRTCGGRSDQKSSCHTFTSNQNIRARYYPGKRAETATRGRHLRPADLIGPHGQSSWWVRFGGRAYLCATEHLRGVTPDEADCLGLDERRQLDELLRAAREVPENYEDLTSQPGPRPPVEVPTEPPKGTRRAVTG